MAKLTLRTFGSDYASKQNLNFNNSASAAALENTLSRDGTGPNAMGADFDMNGHHILNLPTPTAPTDPVRLEDVPTAASLVVIANAAAGSAAAAAASAALAASYGGTGNHATVYNFFDLLYEMNPSGAAALIAQIQNNTAGYLDTPTNYFATVLSRGGSWFFPRGSYHLANTLAPSQGLHFYGVGDYYSDTPALTGTTIYLGGSAGAWGLQQLNPTSGNQYEGFSASDIYFNVTQNGIRLNSVTGGFSDDSSSQGYMMRPRFYRCGFGMDDATKRIGLQFNKSFDFVVEDCHFSGFTNSIDCEGSDIGRIFGCRFDSDVGYSIKARSQGTFGSSLYIANNDFNDPFGFIDSTYLDVLIDFNHMEFDRDQSRGSNAAINISGNAFHTKIQNNRVQPGALVTSWLGITPDVNRFLVSVLDNSTSAPTQMGNVNFANQPYFSNGGTRALIRHAGNSSGDWAFPMNWADGLQTLTPGYYAIVTPSTAGVDGGASNLNPLCIAGAFTIYPNASSTQYMQISDWLAYGLPANTMKGPVTISLTTAAGAAGQVGSWSVLDNGSAVSSGTITHAVANQMYTTTIVTSHTFSGPVQVRLWNADTGTGERFYIYSANFKIG